MSILSHILFRTETDKQILGVKDTGLSFVKIYLLYNFVANRQRKYSSYLTYYSEQKQIINFFSGCNYLVRNSYTYE